VQNWNDGKTQEYKNRKLYDIANSRSMPVGEFRSVSAKEERCDEGDRLVLFTTKTCPNCKIAKEYLKGVPYTVIDAEENADLTRKYSIMQAPTLVEIRNGKVTKYVNASNIKKFTEEELVRL